MSANPEALKWIRDNYNVPAKVGQRIKFTYQFPPREGRIIGAEGGHLKVLFDDAGGRVDRLHPTWEIEYADGEL